MKSTSEDRWDFDRWARSYDETISKAAQSDDWMYRDYDRILDKVVDYCDLPSNNYSTVLDIGVGTGNLASRFLKRGLRVIGIDPSKEMRKICKQKYHNIQIQVGDFVDIRLPAKSVDVIVSTYAFHHLTPEQKEASIPEMKRILKPRGRIVIADLMFRNRFEEEHIRQALMESGRTDIVDDIDDEYYGLFDDLSTLFHQEGFAFHGEQLTAFVWIFGAILIKGK